MINSRKLIEIDVQIFVENGYVILMVKRKNLVKII